MTAPKRIVCYAINGSGLGHVTRLMAVARWLRRYVALLDSRAPEVIFLTSSDASDMLAEAGFAAFKIPSKTVARTADLNKLEYRRLAKHFVWNTLGVFSPDLLVVDTFPSGSFDELFQVLDGPFKTGFIHRHVKAEYAARATFRSALGMYDSVVIPHSRSLDGSPQLGSVCHGHVRYCGEVIQFEREELLPSATVRECLGVEPHRRLVYLSAGGGGDPHAEACLRSLTSALRDQEDLHLLVGAGPLYRGRRLGGPHLTWLERPALGQYFSALDAAVCAGGYNTFHELIFARVPSAFFSQSKIADDQSTRIAAAEARGGCRRIVSVNDAREVVQAVRELLDPTVASSIRGACEQLLPRNGASNCALELIRPLYDHARLEWARQRLTPRIAIRLERVSDGASDAIPVWLAPLMPQGYVPAIASHPGLHGVLSRLSAAAAEEVQQALANQDDLPGQSAFETELVGLLDAIDASSPDKRTGLTEEALKTLLATMKKQPCDALENGNWTRWVSGIVNGVQGLVRLDQNGLSTWDVLMLYRTFPRIVDADARDSLELFTTFLRQRRGQPANEIAQQLQVLKMTHPRMTQAIMDTALRSLTT